MPLDDPSLFKYYNLSPHERLRLLTTERGIPLLWESAAPRKPLPLDIFFFTLGWTAATLMMHLIAFQKGTSDVPLPFLFFLLPLLGSSLYLLYLCVMSFPYFYHTKDLYYGLTADHFYIIARSDTLLLPLADIKSWHEEALLSFHYKGSTFKNRLLLRAHHLTSGDYRLTKIPPDAARQLRHQLEQLGHSFSAA